MGNQNPKSSQHRMWSSCAQKFVVLAFSWNLAPKTCLSKQVFPEVHPENAVKMLYLMIKATFFELLNIKTASPPYSLQTYGGLIECSWRRANGYQIEAPHGGKLLSFNLTWTQCTWNPVSGLRSAHPATNLGETNSRVHKARSSNMYVCM